MTTSPMQACEVSQAFDVPCERAPHMGASPQIPHNPNHCSFLQVTAVMGDQGGTLGSNVPIALKPDFSFFPKMRGLASELRSADLKASIEKKERRLTIQQSHWEGCDKTAEFFQLKQKSRGNSTLASSLLESLGNGAIMHTIAEAHSSTTRQLMVRS
jgi:hypothetical protein